MIPIGIEYMKCIQTHTPILQHMIDSGTTIIIHTDITESLMIVLALFTLLKRCPLRLTTLSKLQWEDKENNNYINLDNQLMVIRQSKTSTKKKEHRKLPLDDNICEILKAHKKYVGSDWVFPDKNNNRTSKS